jgi:hypothetical protein
MSRDKDKLAQIEQIKKIDDPYDLGDPIADLARAASASLSSASLSSASLSSASLSSASRFRLSKLQHSLAFAEHQRKSRVD